VGYTECQVVGEGVVVQARLGEMCSSKYDHRIHGATVLFLHGPPPKNCQSDVQKQAMLRMDSEGRLE